MLTRKLTLNLIVEMKYEWNVLVSTCLLGFDINVAAKEGKY